MLDPFQFEATAIPRWRPPTGLVTAKLIEQIADFHNRFRTLSAAAQSFALSGFSKAMAVDFVFKSNRIEDLGTQVRIFLNLVQQC
jgi:hypothetical protein